MEPVNVLVAFYSRNGSIEKMAQGIADGRIKPGQLLLMEAMGGGLTWGAAVVRL